MKKLFIIAAAMGLLISCGGNTQKNQEQKAAELTPAQPVDAHNARTSLDYMGTYTGEIPAASAPGIIISITLSDSTYVKTMKYVDRGNQTFEDTGKYTWNTEGNTITLQGVTNEPNQYFVGENTLTMLDMEGNRITGELADTYILRK